MSDADRLFHTYFEPLVRYLTRQTGDRDVAEELTQQTFLRALRHREARGAQPTNERAWIFTIATNLLRDSLRRDHRQKRGLEKLHAGRARLLQIGEPDDASPALLALRALSERDRTALLMSEERLTYNEIALALGISVQSVGTTLTRARRRLAQHYESFCRSRTGQAGTNVRR